MDLIIKDTKAERRCRNGYVGIEKPYLPRRKS